MKSDQPVFLRNLLPEISYTDLVAFVLIAIASVFLFSKNIYIDNSVVFHDEYVYKVSADRQLNQQTVLERRLVDTDAIPNKFFLSIYGFGSYFGSNYYVFAQLLNVVFWAFGIFILYRLAVFSGLSDDKSIVYLVGVVLLPFSAYTKYFMPESMYFFMFCLATYVLLIGIQGEGYKAVFFSGIIVGFAYFVKPHAMFMFAAIALYFFFIKNKNRLYLLGAFSFGAFLSVVLGKLFLFKSYCASAYLCNYRGMADSLLVKTPSDPVEGLKLLSDFFHVGFGHSLFLFSVFGMAYLLAVSIIVPKLRFLKVESVISEPLKLVSGYTVFLSIFLLLVSILFTVMAGEMGRIHSRYYFFVFPMLLLIIFHFPTIRLTQLGAVVGSVFCLVTTVLLASFIREYSEILVISLVSDSPELGFAFTSKFILYLSAVSLIGASVFAIFNPIKYGWLVGVIMLLSLLSSADVAAKQKGVFRGTFTTGQEAIAVEQLIGREEMDQLIVVGNSRDIVSKFLFFLSATPNVDYLGSGNSVESSLEKFPQSTWLVTVSQGYDFPSWLDCSPLGKNLTVCSISK